MRLPGCLTPSGLLAALLTLLVIGGIGLFRGGALFNPGPLNAVAHEASGPLGGVRSHAELGGRCAACHAGLLDPAGMAGRCLDCHSDLMTSSQSIHLAMLAESRNQSCHGCHTEHRGAKAALTVLDLERFPHEGLGFSLAAHTQPPDGTRFACSSCHRDNLSTLDLAVCQDCHARLDPAYAQAHLQTFGAGCLGCHDGADRYGADFNHDHLAFALEGEHRRLACEACHARSRTAADLQAAPQACSGCHSEDDAHQGRFGADCAACHTPARWKDATFDHSRSTFPLTGAHQAVSCDGCHANGVYQGTPAACSACHALDDAHQGRFGSDCAACHTPAGWKDATFDHSRSTFPLTGAHQAVSCDGCHANGVFQGTSAICAACHTEPAFHQGLFPGDCETCHTPEAWSPARFDGAHTFPTNHGEGVSSCRTCHPSALSAYTCYGCHAHSQAEIAAKHREEGISDFGDCVRCHATGEEGEGGGEHGGGGEHDD